MATSAHDLTALLERQPVALDPAPVRRLVEGRRVMITGAGGTIGGELARQCAALGCARLALLDNSGGAVWAIDQEIAHTFPEFDARRRQEIICDVRDRARLRAWIAAETPDLVFHAAALKHVNLVERHLAEGVSTNVIGARNVAEAVAEMGRGAMVLISTDKAVSPSSTMGASKRLAEWLVQDRDAAAPRRGESKAKFSVVRFGNVLGSAGSVAPIFLDQIRAGGPVRVTHPDMERYFMTVEEAVQLTLRATALRQDRACGETGVFVLEMGEPMKIVELARRMIDRFGGAQKDDISIVFTGLREGEALCERLFGDDEEARPADAPGVMEVSPRSARAPLSHDLIDALDAMARQDDEAGLRLRLAQIFKGLPQPKPIARREASGG